MRLFPALLPVLLLFPSCNHPTKISQAGYLTDQPLTEAELFRERAVQDYLQDHPGQDRQANELFMKAIDQFRNKKDAAGALPLLTQSLLRRPSAKAYYEWGNASMNVRNFGDAVKAYRMSELLGFEPLSRLLYNEACALSQQGKDEEAIKYLEYAVEAGYTNADQILKDPDLAAARENGYFQTVYRDAMAGNQDPDVVSWLSFRRGFPAATLPLTLNAETEKTISSEAYISYDFEKFVPEMKGQSFSREVGKEFFYLARVSEGPGYTAVIYAVRNSILGDGAPYAYILASFDGKGRLIDKLVAGGQQEPKDLYRVAVIHPNLQIEIKDYAQTYKQDPARQGYTDNKVVATTLKDTRHYTITGDGHFARYDNMIGMR